MGIVFKEVYTSVSAVSSSKRNAVEACFGLLRRVCSRAHKRYVRIWPFSVSFIGQNRELNLVRFFEIEDQVFLIVHSRPIPIKDGHNLVNHREGVNALEPLFGPLRHRNLFVVIEHLTKVGKRHTLLRRIWQFTELSISS